MRIFCQIFLESGPYMDPKNESNPKTVSIFSNYSWRYSKACMVPCWDPCAKIIFRRESLQGNNFCEGNPYEEIIFTVKSFSCRESLKGNHFRGGNPYREMLFIYGIPMRKSFLWRESLRGNHFCVGNPYGEIIFV